jgi:Tfp pilus assembly PilM family ATPase
MGTFRGREVVAALDPPLVEFHSLELPPTVFSEGNTEAAKIVRWELGRLTNESVEDVETRYWPLPTAAGPAKDESAAGSIAANTGAGRGLSTPNAIGVAARSDIVNQRVSTCKDAHLICTCLDTGATALARFGAVLNAWKAEEVWGLLDVGYRESRLVLCVEDVPVLVRRAGTGGRDWTQRIADSLQLGFKAAEVHKCDHGIALTARGLRRGSQDPPDAELAAILLGALRGDLRDLAAEIKRSYEYVLSCYPRRRAADLILVGGGAALRRLPEYLNDLLGIPVHRSSEYLQRDSCRLQYASGKQSRLETMALAIGLAIGGL